MCDLTEDDVSLEAEIETLKSIYIHELQVDTNSSDVPEVVTVHLHPATADNAEKQYVRLTLILTIKEQYPFVIPEIKLKNPRGLSDMHINRIFCDVQKKAEERKGGPMLYELIEVVKEHLTRENTPSCQCAICLYGFTDDDVFTKTDCYHYFHSHCLARYISHVLKQAEEENSNMHQRNGGSQENLVPQVLCPVCRSPIAKYIVGDDFPPPKEAENQPEFVMTPETEEHNRQMKVLFMKQKAQGGIIDVEEERKRFLLEISVAPESTVDTSDATQQSPDSNPEDADGIANGSRDNERCSSDLPVTDKRPPLYNSRERRYGQRHRRAPQSKGKSQGQDVAADFSEQKEPSNDCSDHSNRNVASFSNASYSNKNGAKDKFHDRQQLHASSLPNGQPVVNRDNNSPRKFRSNRRKIIGKAESLRNQPQIIDKESGASNEAESCGVKIEAGASNHSWNQNRHNKGGNHKDDVGRKNSHENNIPHESLNARADLSKNFQRGGRCDKGMDLMTSNNNMLPRSKYRPAPPKYFHSNSKHWKADGVPLDAVQGPSRTQKMKHVDPKFDEINGGSRLEGRTAENAAQDVHLCTNKRLGPPPGFRVNHLMPRSSGNACGAPHPPPGFPAR